MSGIGENFRRAARAIVGDIAWTRPAWLARSDAALSRGVASVRANPRQFALVG